MKIKWLGHACFLLTADSGTRVVTDPYESGALGLAYGSPTETADIVTVSHEHPDHNNVAALKGNPKVVKEAGLHQVNGIDFKGIATSHDQTAGARTNIVFCFTLDGVRVCHLGDLGHELSDKTINQIAPVDVLLVPVGGIFTIDADAASNVVDAIAPKIAIPMHFQTERSWDFPVATVERFQKKRQRVRVLETSEMEVKERELPAETETIILKPAL